jgi:hypothetical protein
MNWFKLFRPVGSAQKTVRFPIGIGLWQVLGVEQLEDRVVPVAPTILSVTPGTGATLASTGVITVEFSENVTGAGASATDVSHFDVFASNGSAVTIGSISGTLNANGTYTTTLSHLTLNGTALPAGTYSLYVVGSAIKDATGSGDPLAQPGQLVVANVGQNSLSTASITSSGLGAVSTISLPAEGTTNFTPSAIASADLNDDGIADLIVVSSAQNTVNIYLGESTGGFDSTPDLTLNLPTGASPSALLVTDLNGDGKPDIAVANSATGNVTVFLNQSSGGQLQFSNGTSYTVADGINGIAAGVFQPNNNDVDLAFSDATADANNNYDVYYLLGNGDGTFGSVNTVAVGSTTPTNLTAPTGIAAGVFTGGGRSSLAVGGSDGVALLNNTSTGTTTSFAETYVDADPVTSIATGVVRTNPSNAVDVVATSASNGGELYALLNNGSGSFQLTSETGTGSSAVTNPTGLQLQSLTGNGLDPVYVNDVAAGGLVSRSPLQTGLISNVTDDTANGNLIQITSTAHGLLTGQRVTIVGVQGATAANGTWYVTVINANTFDLQSSTGTGLGTYTLGTGTWIALPGVITNATQAGGSISSVTGNGAPVVITSANNGLTNGQYVTVTGVGGNTAANGTFQVENVTANTFQLVGATGNGNYTSGGTWTGVIAITAPNHGLRTGQQITISGVQGATGANGTFFVTVVNANTFTLNGTTGTPLGAAYTADTGTYALPVDATGATPVGVALTPIYTGTITAVSGTGLPITITSANNNLQNGQYVTITGVKGNTAANGTFMIQDATTNTFELVGATGNGNYTGGGTWTAAIDFAGDGITDAVTANSTDNTTGSLSYFTGSGTSGVGDGTFLTASNLALTSSGTPTSVAVGDLNGDGIPDLVATDAKNNRVLIYQGLTGGGYSTTPIVLSLTTGGNSLAPDSVALGDVNGDGKLDLVVASKTNSNVAVFLNTSSGGAISFGTPTRYNVGSTPTDVVLASLRGNGTLDILVAHNGNSGRGGNSNARGVTVLLGNGNGTFQNGTEVFAGSKSAPYATAIVVGDFTNNGILDFAVTDANPTGPGTVRVALGSGNGQFPSAAISTYTVGTDPVAITTADFNNDGYLDLATASGSATTTSNVSVLLNNLGTGFATAINTTVAAGAPLNGIAAVHVGTSPFVDLVVTSQTEPTSKSPPPPPNPINNTYVLYGDGDGSFAPNVGAFTVAGGTSGTTPLPSTVAVVSDPFVQLSSFDVGGSTISVNLVRNGNFSERDLTGEQGNLDGWTTYALDNSSPGSEGQWLPQTGSTSPLSFTTVSSPVGGKYQAMLDESNLQPYEGNSNPNAAASYAGSQALYQDITIPSDATSVTLSLSLYLDNAAASGWSDAATTPDLNYADAAPNQQVRVDILSPSGDILDVTPSTVLGGTVLDTVFQTTSATTTNGTVTISGISLLAYAGQTVRLRIAATNNQGLLIVGVNNVKVQTVFTDTTSPQFLSLTLRNPTYLASPNSLEQSTDPTITGQVSAAGGVNNIKSIAFDLGDDNFGAGEAVITQVDANGYFTFTPTGLLPGVQSIAVRVTDGAGNTVTQTFQFILQGSSLTNWQADGPGPIDVSSAGYDYTTVSGTIEAVATDPRDPSGNTIYIGSDNGGVWKTTDGGQDWLATTDDVTNALGQRVNVSVGAMALTVDQTTGDAVIYAATGVDQNTFTAQPSIGVLRSTDDGRTWTLLGGDSASGAGIFDGAYVSALAIDPTDPNTVYVAITSWVGNTKSPMILKTTNGLSANPTWTDVLNPADMITNQNTGATLGAGYSTLASVTSLVIDPNNPDRIIIGLGNIGQRAADASAGVWKSTDGGASWVLVTGGDNPNIPNNTIPTGVNVGRVTVAIGYGPVSSEPDIYVLISSPLALGDTSVFSQGTEVGLYKSKDNMLNFTDVMLKQAGPGNGPGTQNYVTIGLLGEEGGNVGSLAVDPSDPNVVYVGGSTAFSTGTTPQHALIRVDTGNMRDTTYVDPLTGDIPNDGDDITKAEAAEKIGTASAPLYPAFTPMGSTTAEQADYTGEGVSWYDVIEGASNSTGTETLLPPTIDTLAFDTQGRLLIGTNQGIWRGVALGFGYNWVTGPAGILSGQGGGAGGGGGSTKFDPPGMSITSLNGNLQITDVTSVAIDPTDSGTYYISTANSGTAETTDGGTTWATIGLTGPTVPGVGNLGIPSSLQIITAPNAPGATDAVTTLYRTWQYNGDSESIIPEVSDDGGQTFSTTASAGISSQDTAGLAPVLAVNSTQVEVNGAYYDQLLFGDDKVYLTSTGGNVWDAISGVLSSTGNVSALAFSPTAGEYLAGTSDGKVFIKTPTGSAFTSITGNLSGLITGSFGINGITVDPTNPATVYVMVEVANGESSVYRTTNVLAPSVSWTAVTGGLPKVTSYTLVINTQPSSAAPNGQYYLGTQVGVYTSVDGGKDWTPLGQGLPAAPVVYLSFNPTLNVLAAATLGRGVFTLSTATSGPAVVGADPNGLASDTPVTSGALDQVTVTFNEAVDPRTFTAASDQEAREIMALEPLSSVAYATTLIENLNEEYLRTPATQAQINYGLGVFFDLTPSGTIAQTTNAFLAGAPLNVTQPDGEFTYIADLVANPAYFTNPSLGNSSNATWLNQVEEDLFGVSDSSDPQAATTLAYLNANSGANAYAARLEAALQYVGLAPIDQYGDLNALSKQFDTNVVAGLFDQYLGRNYPTAGASSTEISTQVTALQSGTPILYVAADLLASTEAYQSEGTNYALPAGVHADALAYADLSGATASNGDPILDLIVAGSDNRVYVFQGRAGGGYALDPTLVLALPAGAAPSQIVTGDFNGDGLIDIAVANSGLTSSSANSVSVFLNSRSSVGALAFGARTDYNGGNNPVGLAVADVDADGHLDLIAADGTANGSNQYTATVLLGSATGTFGAPTALALGTTALNKLTTPTGIAVGDLNGDSKPDLVFSGANGVLVLINTTTAPGTPTFSPQSALLSTVATTSVAVGKLDATGKLDVAATSDQVNGEVLIFQNSGSATFTTTTVAVGQSPRAVQLVDLNGDGIPDLVVTNDYVGGGVTVLYNTTQPVTSGTPVISFAAPLVYPVTGSQPTALAVGDTNQDGLPDLAVGYAGSQYVSLILGQEVGIFQTASDQNWMDYLYETLTGTPPTQVQQNEELPILEADALAYLVGPKGAVEPLAITPTDGTDLTYTITFAPQVIDGTYQLYIGPNLTGNVLKDFTDLNGTYVDTGNAMNQNGNATNGQLPTATSSGDQYTETLAVNHSDDGQFVTSAYTELLNRQPDAPSFAVLISSILQPAQTASLTAYGTTLLGSVTEVDNLVTAAYETYLGRAPNGTELSLTQAYITTGQASIRNVVVGLLASPEYFTDAGSSNATWVNDVYLAMLGLSNVASTPAGSALVAQLNAGTLTRGSLATLLVFNPAVLARTAAQYFQELMGRAPVTNPDPALNELTPLVALLQLAPQAGQLSGDQQLILALTTSAEYFQVNGDSNTDWLTSLYALVYGKTALASSSTLRTQFTADLNTILTNSTTARQTVLSILIGSQEYRNNVYTQDYNTFLNRAPTAAELTKAEQIYQNYGQRLELIPAYILSTSGYFPLTGAGSSNATWLSNVYGALLDESTSGNSAATAQLTYLNSQTSANLSNARLIVAYNLLNSDTYRSLWITNVYETYLDRAPTSADLSFWLSGMDSTTNPYTEQQVLILLLRMPEYFLDHTS